MGAGEIYKTEKSSFVLFAFRLFLVLVVVVHLFLFFKPEILSGD